MNVKTKLLKLTCMEAALAPFPLLSSPPPPIIQSAWEVLALRTASNIAAYLRTHAMTSKVRKANKVRLAQLGLVTSSDSPAAHRSIAWRGGNCSIPDACRRGGAHEVTIVAINASPFSKTSLLRQLFSRGSDRKRLVRERQRADLGSFCLQYAPYVRDAILTLLGHL